MGFRWSERQILSARPADEGSPSRRALYRGVATPHCKRADATAKFRYERIRRESPTESVVGACVPRHLTRYDGPAPGVAPNGRAGPSFNSNSWQRVRGTREG